MDIREFEARKRAFDELEEDKEQSSKRIKLVTIQERFTGIYTENKPLLNKATDWYKKLITEYSEDYMENKRYKKYYAINVIGKELFIEAGNIDNNNKKVVFKRTFDSHEKACEDAVEVVSKKVAEGYKRVYKTKEYHIDYSKAIDQKTVAENTSQTQNKPVSDSKEVHGELPKDAKEMNNRKVQNESDNKVNTTARSELEDAKIAEEEAKDENTEECDGTDLIVSEKEDSECEKEIREAVIELEARYKSN